MPIPGIHFFIENPFVRTRPVTTRLRDCASAFQQAMECIISKKTDTALPFKKEVNEIRKEIEEMETVGIFRTGWFRKMAIRPTLCYRYLRAQVRIARRMETVLEWILVRKHPVSDPLETELFLLADAAGESVEELERLSAAISAWVGKRNRKTHKRALKTAREILDKTANTMEISRRTKQKVLEMDTDPASMVHLMELAGLVEQIAEDCDEITRIAFFVLHL